MLIVWSRYRPPVRGRRSCAPWRDSSFERPVWRWTPRTFRPPSAAACEHSRRQHGLRGSADQPYESAAAPSLESPIRQFTCIFKTQYAPPTRLNCRLSFFSVELSRVGRSAVCIRNSQLVGESLDKSEQFCQRRSRVASCRRCERTRSSVVTQFTIIVTT